MMCANDFRLSDNKLHSSIHNRLKIIVVLIFLMFLDTLPKCIKSDVKNESTRDKVRQRT